MRGGTETQRSKLCQLLRSIREEAGVFQVDLANKLGRQQSFVSKYESGEKTLTFLEVRDICHALDLPFHEFIDRYERMQ